MGLIDELKDDHMQMAELLGSLKGRELNADQKMNKLMQAKMMLIAHLEKEEKLLYPAIIESTSLRAYSIAGEFAKDMKNLSAEINEHFTTFANDLNRNQSLKGLGTVIAKLSTRIRREENILYPEYEKTTTSSAISKF